jgi:hypothetical protein
MQALSHNVVLRTPRHEWDSNSKLYCRQDLGLGLGLWSLYTLFQIYHGGQFYRGGHRGTQKKHSTCCKSLTDCIT